MNCCSNDRNSKSNKKKWWSHALCFTGPLIAIGMMTLRSFGVISAESSGFAYILFLLCPLSHFLVLTPFLRGKSRGKDKGDAVVSNG